MNTLRREITDCAAELTVARKNNAQLTEQLADLTAAHEALLRSRSWRLTAPLRKASAARPWVSTQLRRSGRVAWWIVTLQLPRRLAGRDAAQSNPAAPATAIEPSTIRAHEESTFDRAWYLSAYPDVLATGLDPLEHYLASGKAEGRHPTAAAMESSVGFDRDWYLATNPDIAAAGLDPFQHWFLHGKFEGRHSNACYSFTPGQRAVLARSYHYRDDAPIEASQPVLDADTPLPAQNADVFDSAQYWSERYRTGGNSGAGSYGRLAEFKAEIVNAFVHEHEVASVIELGCGDGAQLALAEYPGYVGFDVANESVELCRTRFVTDATKQFRPLSTWDNDRADLVLSLDVIYHLIEDDAFHDYMRRLFFSAERYVIVYSSNHEAVLPTRHVRHRRFTDWIEIYQSDFRLVRHIPNRWPLVDDGQTQSFADFYIFEKRPTRKHTLPGHLVVSLTSYAGRFATLELTLRRILQQSVQPDETVLWLTEDDRAQLPEGVLALEKQGLAIHTAKELRSYKKIIPALERYPDSFILTLDDDIAYPLDTVEQIVAAYRNPSEIICRRAHKPVSDETGRLRSYNQWQFDTLDESGPDLFPTGSGGILYPPHSLAPEVMDETIFTTLAPQADDIWLFWMGRLAGSTTRRAAASRFLQPWPGSQENGLWSIVNAHGGNDRVIEALTARYGVPATGGGMQMPGPRREDGTGAPLGALLKRFVWSGPSAHRNELTHRYEPVQPFLFLALTRAAGSTVVFDVGANIGLYSILSTCTSSVREVHAFEIEETAFGELRYNILGNRLEDKVKSHFVAVSDREGFVDFGVARPMGENNGIIDTTIHAKEVYGETRRVRSAAMDNLFMLNDKAIALKIDVEGHEYNVLVGCKRLLKDNRCIIQMEIYQDDGRITGFLASIGYRQIFRANVDYYFSNDDAFFDPARVLICLESAVAEIVDLSLNG